MVGSAPSQPSPPKVIRQPSSQPLPRWGECGQRSAIWRGSRLLPYAAYSTPRRLSVPSPRRRDARMPSVTRVVIVGGGPGGYEAALVGSQLGGEVTLIDSDGLGGSAVLTDCVPSKTLIATAEVMTEVSESAELGLRFGADDPGDAKAGRSTSTSPRSTSGCSRWPSASPRTSSSGSLRENVRLVNGRGRLDGPDRVIADTADGEQTFDADVVLLATGRPSARAAGRQARRRADPHLDPGLRADRAARTADRRRLGGDRRGVRQRVRRPRLRGRAGLVPRPGAARRGRRRGAGAGGRVRPARA